MELALQVIERTPQSRVPRAPRSGIQERKGIGANEAPDALLDVQRRQPPVRVLAAGVVLGADAIASFFFSQNKLVSKFFILI